MYTLVDQIKQRLDIRTALQQFTNADISKLRGERGHVCCPFHSEKTGSFFIDTRKNTWHCFGSCATGGDVISLYATARGVGNTEAIHELAGLLGIVGQPPTKEDMEAIQRAKEQRNRIQRAEDAVWALCDKVGKIHLALHTAMQDDESYTKEQMEKLERFREQIEELHERLICISYDDDPLGVFYEAEEVVSKWNSLKV